MLPLYGILTGPSKPDRYLPLFSYDSDFSSPVKKRRLGDEVSIAVRPAASVAPTFGQQKIRVVVESPTKKGSLPTPAASSQLEARKANGTGIPYPLSRTLNSDCYWIESSEDEPTPARKRQPRPIARQAEPILSATTAIRNGNTALDSDSDEDIEPARSARRNHAAPINLSSDERVEGLVTPKQRKITQIPKGRIIVVDDLSDGEDMEAPAKKLRQKLSISPRTQKDPFVVSEEGDAISSDDDVVTPVRRRRITATLPSPTKEPEIVEENSEDLQDEVEDLQGSGDVEIRETRTRGLQDTSARSIRQHKLEELRRRRAGIQDDPVSEGEDGQDPGDENEVSEVEPLQDAIRRGDDLDEYEEDFVDDENDTLGVDLGRAGVPLEFTYHANKKTIDHFTTEIEWMVHNKINPAFDRYDEIYLLAHDKLDTEFQGFAGSKFISSVWRPNFDKALKTRPELYRVEIPTMFEAKCDACNRSNHPPKHRVTFSGKAYDRKTLETIENEDDEDDSSDDESKEKASSSSEHEENFFLGR